MKKKLMIMLIVLLGSLYSVNAQNETLTLNVTSPETKTYNTTNIDLNVTASKLSGIFYNLNGINFTGCLNCSGFSSDLNITQEGTYNLKVTAVSGNETANKTIVFLVDLQEVFDINIKEPKSITYNTTTVPISINTTSIVDKMEYRLDSGNKILLCNNCNSITSQLNNLTNGIHTFTVMATKGSESKEKSVSFNVNTSVKNGKGFSNGVDIKVNIKGNLDSTQISLFNELFQSLTEDLRNVRVEIKNEEDNHLKVKTKGSLKDNERDLVSKIVDTLEDDDHIHIMIKIKPKKIEIDDDAEKSVNDYIKGDLDEDEFEKIIKTKKLSPGAIKKLIREGDLSKEELDSLLENQKIPPNVLQKSLGYIGQGNNEALEELMEKYNLNDKQMKKLLEKQNVLPGTLNKIITKEKLDEESIEVIIYNYDLNEGQLKNLLRKQSLSSDNVDKLLNKGLSDDINEELSKNQVLSKKQKELLKKEKEKEEVKVRNDKSERGKGLNIGVQEDQKTRIKVDIEDGKSEVEIKIGNSEQEFTLATTDESMIISEIQKRTGLNIDNIKSIIRIERED